MNKEREEGYYWVNCKTYGWQIASWEDNNWLLHGVDQDTEFGDDDFEEIIETPIPPKPDEVLYIALHTDDLDTCDEKDITESPNSVPFFSPEPKWVTDEEIDKMAKKYINGMPAEISNQNYYSYFHGASDMRDLLTKEDK